MSSEILDKFVEEKSWQAIWSLAQITTFNWEFRIMARLVAEGHSNPEELKKACSALTQAANDMAGFYNTHHREAPLYEVGDMVWLNVQNITIMCPMKKLDHRWISLYVVDKVIFKMPTCSNDLHPLANLTWSSQSPYYDSTVQMPSPNEYNTTCHLP